MFLNLDSLQTNMDTYFVLRHADELEDYNIAKSALDGKQAIEGSTDTYASPYNITSFIFSDTNNTYSPDITYRAFGTSRYIYYKYNYGIATNTEILSTAEPDGTRIVTSERNLTDVFAVYNSIYDTYKTKIEIKHIDP